ncbi:flagellar filament capping protein FliD [Aneurinibacillus uraniidurans]|uniref:flagellar filament capping protein FliD n=1 Tax=Aneurinibacillus uraniidurans TaxID=2966586 RepID=UPI00234951C2|nr:flagellar filament capping protein FliD [Aneurinibacillus sp. B1]WCN38146.1 flagellar filament capping protein FliD [Aneurinibacillus sp. B1]
MPNMRITGMSGFDTEGTVKKLMDAERIPLNKMMGQQQVLRWKQDLYRDINKSFAALNSAVDKMRYVSSWGSYKVSSSNSGAVSVTNGSANGEATHSIEVTRLAETAKKTGTSLATLSTSDVIQGNIYLAPPATLPDFSSPRSMSVAFGGVTKTIQITSADNVKDTDTLQSALQSKLDAAFGSDAIAVDLSTGSITMKPGVAFAASKPGIKVMNYGSDALATELGLDGLTSKIELTTKIEDLRSKLGISSTVDIVGQKDITTLASNYFTSTSPSPRQMNIEINNISHTIDIPSDGSVTNANLATYLQSQIESIPGVGAGNVAVTEDPSTHQLKINTAGALAGQKIKIANSGKDTLAADLGLNGQSNFDLTGIQINGANIPRVSAGQSVQSLMNAISASSAGVRLSYENTNQTFSFTSKDSGATSMVNFSGSNGAGLDFLNKIGVSPATSVYGQDAEVKIDGITMTRSSNTFTQDGVTYTLNQVTTGPVGVNVQQDTDGIFEKISDFVTKYNDMVSLVSGKLTEKTTYRKYAPLNADQKQAMKDTEITIWEEKAKGGLLHNDSMLKSALDDLRSRVTSPVSGTKPGDPSMLSQIGIDTSKNMSESGKLVIDEEKLRKAISDNPSGVIALFTAKSSVSDKKSEQYKSESGIAVRLFQRIDVFNHGIMDEINTKIENKLNASDSSALEKQIQDFQRRIDDMNTSLSQKEDAYYRKFAAVEKALSNANSQSSWLASQLGGGK